MRLSLKTLIIFLWLLLSSNAIAWQKDKIYSITILHTNDHHGHFWHNKNGEYGLAAQKTLVTEIRHEVAKKGELFYCFLVVILTLVCLNPICKMLSQILKA